MQYIHVNVSLIDVIRYVVKYLSLCRPLWGLRYLRKWNAYEHWQLDMCHTFISEYNNRSRQQVERERDSGGEVQSVAFIKRTQRCAKNKKYAVTDDG